MMIPTEILMLPLYKLMVSFKMINTYWGVIVPTMVAPIAIFFFRQYALGLPKELLDAARIDGCSEFRSFFQHYGSVDEARVWSDGYFTGNGLLE